MAGVRVGERPLRLHGLDDRAERAVLETAADILSTGLIDRRSIFTPEKSLWIGPIAEEVIRALDRSLTPSTKNYASRLHRNLRQASPNAIQLAAEMQYLMYLAAADVKPETKREKVAELLDLLPDRIHLPMRLSQATEFGVFNVGMGFKMQGWRQLHSLYTFVHAWSGLPASVQQAAASDPWHFKQVVHSGKGAQAMRNLLMYLAFPDVFEPIVSQKHKEDIRHAFIGEVRAASEDVDRDLLAIRDSLEKQTGATVSFYTGELVRRWRSPSPGAVKPPHQKPQEPTDPTRKAWLVRGSSIRGVDLVPLWLEQNFCSLSASNLPDAAPGMSREQLRERVQAGYSFASYNEQNVKVGEFYDFLTRMSPDDIVATITDGQMYLGRVTDDAKFEPSPDGRYNLTRSIEWVSTEDPVEVSELPALLRARLRTQQDVVDLTRDLPHLATLLALPNVPDEQIAEVEAEAAVPQAELPDATENLADDLLVPRKWLQEVVELLRERRQIVLYGPPGTGKTYLAKQLGQYLTNDPQNVTLVQFHPTYNYEDFFEGYRPRVGADGGMSFELRPGPFRRLVDRAREDPSRPYLLIIDELNRANLASVFGELYFLLEYRDEAIALVHSGDEQGFTLPENVYVIGTMNTADRSIALMDTAMRRRFGFMSLHPADEPVRDLLKRWLERHGHTSLAAELLTELNERIGNHEMAVGPSYFMGDPVRENGPERLRQIWKSSILPLLEEQHYGRLNPAEIAELYGLDQLLAVVQPDATDPTTTVQ